MGDTPRNESAIVAQTDHIGETLFSLFDPTKFDQALANCGFSLNEELQILTDIVRSETNVWSKLAALRAIRQAAKEALELSGGVTSMTARVVKTAADGTILEAEKRTHKLLTDAGNIASVMLKKEDVYGSTTKDKGNDEERTAAIVPARHCLPEPGVGEKNGGAIDVEVQKGERGMEVEVHSSVPTGLVSCEVERDGAVAPAEDLSCGDVEVAKYGMDEWDS